MTLADYTTAQLPTAPVILGVALRPYALGHALLLARVGSPFAVASGDPETRSLPGIGDLLLALEICRHEPFHLPTGPRRAWLAFRHRKLPEGALLDACIAFADYVNTAHRLPAHTSKGEGGDSGIPWLQALKVTLISKLHKTEADALRTPLQLAILDCFAVWAALGTVELGDRRKAMLDKLAEVEGQIARGEITLEQLHARTR